jgi:hypothetical protein
MRPEPRIPIFNVGYDLHCLLLFGEYLDMLLKHYDYVGNLFEELIRDRLKPGE